MDPSEDPSNKKRRIDDEEVSKKFSKKVNANLKMDIEEDMMEVINNPSNNLATDEYDKEVEDNRQLKTTADFENYLLRPDCFPYCELVGSKYQKIAQIGAGTYGTVFKARTKSNPSQLVALKKLKMENETQGFPLTALREIKILKGLSRHENVVSLIEVCRDVERTSGGRFSMNAHMVFEYVENDLAGLLVNQAVTLSVANIKSIMKQLFEALYFLQVNNILHRDLKPANILISKDGVLKVADFGLARPISFTRNGVKQVLTTKVCTLWYRAPEILLGDKKYSFPADMWSAGCIMVEIIRRRAFIHGTSEIEQLDGITAYLGSIDKTAWPSVENLALYKSIILPQGRKRHLREFLFNWGCHDKDALDLVDQIFKLDPNKRIKPDDALNADYFWKGEEPGGLKNMLLKMGNSQLLMEVQNRERVRRNGPNVY